LGPLGSIAILQKEHSDRLAEKQRPELSAIAKPQYNLATSSTANGDAGPGLRCYICQDPGHLANSCPNLNKKNISFESTVQTINKSAHPLEEREYCRPANLTKTLPFYGK